MRTAIAELISAARGQAERLRRQSFSGVEPFEQRLTQAEAEWWMELADHAEQEVAAGFVVGRQAKDEDDHD